MLTYADEPTIRFAILRRLDTERGVKVCEIKTVPHPRATPPYLAVGVLALIDDAIITRSLFHLPGEFDLAALHNEIDEIAEQFKMARQDHFKSGGLLAEKELLGTGLRGRWGRHV